MPVGRLTDLQARVLTILAPVRPAWTLTGGAALVGFHTFHRTTRDLDLLWHGERALGALPQEVRVLLEVAGLTVENLQTTASFVRLRVHEGVETVVVDLVMDPSPALEQPSDVSVGGVVFRVETPHTLLVDKLCALLGRSELRDLVDVRVLLAAGGDLGGGLTDAPRKDGGFSPLTLAWVLQGLPIRLLGGRLGWTAVEIHDSEQFRDELVQRLTVAATPG